jgi:putative transposase
MAKREAADYLAGEESLPVHVACSTVGLSRATFYKRPQMSHEKDQPTIDGINQVVSKNGLWGFGLCFAYLHNQGAPWNHKRVWRVYKDMD